MKILIKATIIGIIVEALAFALWAWDATQMIGIILLLPGILVAFTRSPHPSLEDLPFLIIPSLLVWIGIAALTLFVIDRTKTRSAQP